MTIKDIAFNYVVAFQRAVVEEQKIVCGTPYQPLSYEAVRDLELLDRCLKETLRLRPPIMTMMRMVKTEQVHR